MEDMEDLQQAQQAQQIDKLKKELLAKILTKEAVEKLSRVKLVNPQLALQVELYLIQLFQAGKLKNMVDDQKIKDILRVLTQKSDFRIKRM